MPASDLKLSSDQEQALDRIADWWDGREQEFTLAGYAGTGKTTVISQLLKRHGDRALVAAPTGKAALRLRQKGVSACTIHQLAYKFTGYDDHGNPVFDFTGAAAGQKMVIVDEASMVNKTIYDDLIGDGYRILFVGDHGQLPPVGEDPGIMRNPDFELTVIHRQDDSGLLEFAHQLREGVFRPTARGAVTNHMLDPWMRDPKDIEALTAADTVICWQNKTRHMLNHKVMAARGQIPADLRYKPDCRDNVRAVLEHLCEARETIPAVCLRNNGRERCFNGQVFEMRILEVNRMTVHTEKREAGSEQDWRETLCDIEGFRGDLRGYTPGDGAALFDFGSVLTAHKSQGSEWDSVTVYDDTFRTMRDRPRWAYTAATRAKERLTWMYR